MASRVLFRRRAAPVAVAFLGAVVLTPRAVYAEAPSSSSKKPIYDDLELSPTTSSAITALPPSPSTSPPTSSAPTASESKPRGPTPTDRLATQIGKARLLLYKYAVKAEDAVNATMDKAFHLEQSFTGTVASLAPPRDSGEKLMPGAIYVLVAAMAGSIVTRNRNVLLRATAPLALGITAGWVVLPITMGNVADLAWKYEQRVPAVAKAHLEVRNGLEKGWSFAKVHSQVGVRYVDEKVTDAREAVEDWVKKGK